MSTSTDPMRVYLEQIGRHPLMGAEEERRVARLAHVGDPAARRRLVESNLRLVVAIARRHARAGVEPLDLIQEGNIGLMEAAERFDPAPRRPLRDLRRLVDPQQHAPRRDGRDRPHPAT